MQVTIHSHLRSLLHHDVARMKVLGSDGRDDRNDETTVVTMFAESISVSIFVVNIPRCNISLDACFTYIASPYTSFQVVRETTRRTSIDLPHLTLTWPYLAPGLSTSNMWVSWHN